MSLLLTWSSCWTVSQVATDMIMWNHSYEELVWVLSYSFSYIVIIVVVVVVIIIIVIIIIIIILIIVIIIIIIFNLLYPPQRSLGGGYTGFTLFVRPSVCPSVCLSVRPSVCPSVRPSVRPWVGVRMITLILFSGFKKSFLHIYHLGQDLAWDWISASYLIKYAHTGRSCDLLIFGIPEVNFLVRAFECGMKGVLSRIYDISPGFCWIPIFVFFLNFLRVS